MTSSTLATGIVLSFFLLAMMSSQANAPVQVSPLGSLSMNKLSTTATQTSPGCYSGFVGMNMTWTGSNSTYGITVQDFFVIINVPNQTVGNQTSTSYNQPTNTFSQLLLFPNLPVTLQ